LRINPLAFVVPLVAAAVGAWALVCWYGEAQGVTARVREPGQDDRAPAELAGTAARAELLTPGPPRPEPPANLPGSWPQFRGPGRDGVAAAGERVARTWPSGGPEVLWRTSVGEGHAGPVISGGRVYLVDYDRSKGEDAIRCLSLADGGELWRYSYGVQVKRNHGMSRTAPAVEGKYLVALGPKCQVHCLNAETGELFWKIDLVKEFGTTVPPWYAGQCPLIDRGRAILAPGGDALLMAVDLAGGQVVWKTANPEEWKMTHSSIMPADFGGVRQYVYCGSRGVIAVAADDGRTLWTWPDWKISIATVPSPVVVPPDRLFFTGGYEAGSEMVRLVQDGSAFKVEEAFRLKPSVFACEQQTPILYQEHIYGVAYNGQLTCIDLAGQRLWQSGAKVTFGLGPLVVADGVIYCLADETGELVMAEASPAGYHELGRKKLLDGRDSWAPLAMADGRLILREGNHVAEGDRDVSEMICVRIGPELGAASVAEAGK
jgi:outer membrane protein assembly factor BamB